MKYLVTGGCGFLGSNIAAEVLRQRADLAILDNLSRQGSASNLEWLRAQGQFIFSDGDVRSADTVATFVESFQPDAIFHLAGQVAMTTSIRDPRLDFEVNLLGSLNVLEAVRLRCPSAVTIYSSTNKVYGDLEHLRCEELPRRYALSDYPAGLPETITLDFHSPYGCSKGGADQYFLDYARIYDLSTIVFRHSSMYGGRQFFTVDQGWIGWFCEQAVLQAHGRGGEFTVSGSGKQVRDVLFGDDMVALYLAAAVNARKMKGRAFNVGGGMENSLSILELLDMLSLMLGVTLAWRHIPARESDQRVFVADLSRVKSATGWAPRVDKREGLGRMIEWVTHGQLQKVADGSA
jgi:CDP-paratose 2-epimerase